MSPISREAFLSGLQSYGVSRTDAERRWAAYSAGAPRGSSAPAAAMSAEPARTPVPTLAATSAPLLVVIGDPPLARRVGDRLELVLLFAPRTKKNGTTLGVRQTAGYRRFRNAVVQHLGALRDALGLPLPEGRYNCAAAFYVDNDQADTVGLMQGLADALENAGVVTTDRHLWTWDGTHQELAPLRPRVELTLAPRGPPVGTQ